MSSWYRFLLDFQCLVKSIAMLHIGFDIKQEDVQEDKNTKMGLTIAGLLLFVLTVCPSSMINYSISCLPLVQLFGFDGLADAWLGIIQDFVHLLVTQWSINSLVADLQKPGKPGWLIMMDSRIALSFAIYISLYVMLPLKITQDIYYIIM